MPIYEFKCPECGLTVEIFTTYEKSQDKNYCPCGAILEKQVSLTGKAQWKCDCPTVSGGK